jgi:hypothetical protein
LPANREAKYAVNVQRSRRQDGNCRSDQRKPFRLPLFLYPADCNTVVMGRRNKIVARTEKVVSIKTCPEKKHRYQELIGSANRKGCAELGSLPLRTLQRPRGEDPKTE